jgi:hypothetical protein
MANLLTLMMIITPCQETFSFVRKFLSHDINKSYSTFFQLDEILRAIDDLTRKPILKAHLQEMVNEFNLNFLP